MTNFDIYQACEKATIRFEKVIHIGAALAGLEGGSAPDELVEFIDDLDLTNKTGRAFVACFNGLEDEIKGASSFDVWDFGNFALESGQVGFMGAAHTPVRDEDGDFNWGHCYIGRFYGDTFEDLVAKASAWAKEMQKPKKVAQDL